MENKSIHCVLLGWQIFAMASIFGSSRDFKMFVGDSEILASLLWFGLVVWGHVVWDSNGDTPKNPTPFHNGILGSHHKLMDQTKKHTWILGKSKPPSQDFNHNFVRKFQQIPVVGTYRNKPSVSPVYEGNSFIFVLLGYLGYVPGIFLEW